MNSSQRLVNFLRSKEFSEDELLHIYRSFLRSDYERGFNDGCEFMRSSLRRQKSARRKNVKKKFDVLYSIIDSCEQ